jgi:hypothetical protein
MASADTPRRSFWVHQAAEYLIGVALVASGLQSPSPVVPAVLGGIVILNAAVVDGPLGAFRAVGRRTHRVLDVCVLVLLAAGVLWPGVDAATRVVVLGLGIVMAFVVAKTNYAPKHSRATSGDGSAGPGSRSERYGRTAGRVTGLGVQSAKRKIAAVQGDQSEPSSD